MTRDFRLAINLSLCQCLVCKSYFLLSQSYNNWSCVSVSTSSSNQLHLMIELLRVFQMALRGGGIRNFAEGLSGGGNLRKNDFNHSNLFQS